MTSNGRGFKRLSGWAGCDNLCFASQLSKHIQRSVHDFPPGILTPPIVPGHCEHRFVLQNQRNNYESQLPYPNICCLLCILRCTNVTRKIRASTTAIFECPSYTAQQTSKKNDCHNPKIVAYFLPNVCAPHSATISRFVNPIL